MRTFPRAEPRQLLENLRRLGHPPERDALDRPLLHRFHRRPLAACGAHDDRALQTLDRAGIYPQTSYLSAVSGGSYMAGAWTIARSYPDPGGPWADQPWPWADGSAEVDHFRSRLDYLRSRTGRSINIPIIRQFVLAAPGKYVLRGQYMSSRLRLEEGLAWAARCSNSGTAALAGRSEGLHDTGGKWQSFEFPISIPANCGVVFSLQLETMAPYAAPAGAKGRAAFDALELIPQSL